MKEVRGGNLIATIKTNLPHVGFVKLDTRGRKAKCTWRGFPFVISSRLVVQEEGLCGKTVETEDSLHLQNKLRQSA